MDFPIDAWYDAIFLRHSQRKYSGKVPNDEVTRRIEEVCAEFRPFSGARAVLVKEPANDVFKGAVGPYVLRVTEAPYYIAFVANMNAPNIQAITGYLGEGVILEATSLGLNTCWVGGFFRRNAVLKQIDLHDDERVLAITPVGYSKQKLDRVGGSSKRYRRKSLDRLIVSGELDDNKWIETALEAVRIAPSAANRQPWRFQISNDSVTVLANSRREGLGVSRKLDCGIAMLHLELGALTAGSKGSWEFLQYPGVARYKVS
ncbi:MAG: nitroreductase family protein [Candidatus Thorarchaeota archaeon]|nr:MAG: nitroreductase family protein [Candidatus Thorarchaeota archaeon]